MWAHVKSISHPIQAQKKRRALPSAFSDSVLNYQCEDDELDIAELLEPDMAELEELDIMDPAELDIAEDELEEMEVPSPRDLVFGSAL